MDLEKTVLADGSTAFERSSEHQTQWQGNREKRGDGEDKRAGGDGLGTGQRQEARTEHTQCSREGLTAKVLL